MKGAQRLGRGPRNARCWGCWGLLLRLARSIALAHAASPFRRHCFAHAATAPALGALIDRKRCSLPSLLSICCCPASLQKTPNNSARQLDQRLNTQQHGSSTRINVLIGRSCLGSQAESTGAMMSTASRLTNPPTSAAAEAQSAQ
jgi:hypothetical protein